MSELCAEHSVVLCEAEPGSELGIIYLFSLYRKMLLNVLIIC